MSNNGNTPDISEMINKIMQDPQLSEMMRELKGNNSGSSADTQADIMEKLPQIMSVISPLIGDGARASDKDEKNDGKPTVKSKEARGFEKYDKARATRLMSAIKPYLSRERCSMIDKCMSVMQLGDVMTVLRGLEGFGNTDG